MKVFDQAEEKATIRKIKQHNKKMDLPQWPEYVPHLDQVASALYVFLSRRQVEALPKLGLLAQYLSALVGQDLTEKRSSLRQSRLREEENSAS